MVEQHTETEWVTPQGDVLPPSDNLSFQPEDPSGLDDLAELDEDDDPVMSAIATYHRELAGLCDAGANDARLLGLQTELARTAARLAARDHDVDAILRLLLPINDTEIPRQRYSIALDGEPWTPHDVLCTIPEQKRPDSYRVRLKDP